MPGSTPGIPEIDEMVRKSQQMHSALLRVRDLIAAQNATASEQMAQDERYHVQNGLHAEEQGPYQDDSKAGGFAGADPKKRRGVSAPYL